MPQAFQMPDNIAEAQQLIGLPTNATVAEIKKAYRIAALKWHPDKNSDENAEANFKAYGKAYSLLMNHKETIPEDYTSKAADHWNKTEIPLDPSIPDQGFTHVTQQYLDVIGKSVSQIVDVDRIEVDKNTPLDEICTFYALFPFRFQELDTNPFDLKANTGRAVYIGLTDNLERAIDDITMAQLVMCRMGDIDSAMRQLNQRAYLPSGIIYEIKGCPRVIIPCFVRGGFEVLLPLVQKYHIEQTYALPETIRHGYNNTITKGPDAYSREINFCDQVNSFVKKLPINYDPTYIAGDFPREGLTKMIEGTEKILPSPGITYLALPEPPCSSENQAGILVPRTNVPNPASQSTPSFWNLLPQPTGNATATPCQSSKPPTEISFLGWLSDGYDKLLESMSGPKK